ncbi:MAG: transposase [Methylococcales bacterium]
MTNLLDIQRYPVPAFKALYHTRWQIEEGYKRQKAWLEIENFTGKSVLSVQQDYHARILSLNLTAIAVFAAQRHPDRTLPQCKYRYQINFAQALSTMKDTIVKCLYGLISMQGYRQLLETMRQSLTIIRPGRRFERKKRSGASKNFHPCYKRML